MINSAHKGSSFEREISKQLSLWWTTGKRDDVFWRTAGSGARATVRRSVGLDTYNQQGDIAALDPIGEPFLKRVHIEIKRGYNDLSLCDFLDTPKRSKGFAALLHKYKQEAAADNKLLWLIWKRDRKDILLIVSGHDPIFIIAEETQSMPYIIMSLKGKISSHIWIAMRFDQIVQHCCPKLYMEEFSRLEKRQDILGKNNHD